MNVNYILCRTWIHWRKKGLFALFIRIWTACVCLTLAWPCYGTVVPFCSPIRLFICHERFKKNGSIALALISFIHSFVCVWVVRVWRMARAFIASASKFPYFTSFLTTVWLFSFLLYHPFAHAIISSHQWTILFGGVFLLFLLLLLFSIRFVFLLHQTCQGTVSQKLRIMHLQATYRI